MTQQQFCNMFGIARSTLYDRMKANGLLYPFKEYHLAYLIGWLEAELKYNPIRKYGVK